MPDQAHRLRRLVSRVAPESPSSSRARQIVLTGCKGGVGTTTVAINLSLALRRTGQRVLLADADPVRGDVATHLRHAVSLDFNDVAQGRANLSQILMTGPLGVEVAPGGAFAGEAAGPRALQWIRHLDSVAYDFDWILLDAGCCGASAEFFWSTADQAIVVTTDDFVAITDGYALVKSMHRKQVQTPTGVVVNRARQLSLAEDALARLVLSCQRFLDREVTPLPVIQEWSTESPAEVGGRSVLCSPSEPNSLQAFHEIVRQLTEVNLEVGDLNSLLHA